MKIDFNPYPYPHTPPPPTQKKKVTEFCFSSKIVSNNPKPLSFNQNQVKIFESHNHLSLILDNILTFKDHLENKINKCNRIIKPLLGVT